MDAYLAFSSNAKICDSLQTFTLDAEPWLAALYWCVGKCYGDQAARIAADCWLGILENCLEEKSELAELEKITKAAIVLSALRVAKTLPTVCESSKDAATRNFQLEGGHYANDHD